jgi:hypothetical protein
MDPQTNQPPQQPATPPTETPGPAPAQPTPAPTSPEQQPTTPQNDAQPTPQHNPGSTLGIVSIIVSLFGLGLIGLILGIIGLKKSKAVGMGNGAAVAGIVISILSIIGGLLVIGLLFFGASEIVQKCSELGPGTHLVDGVTYTCS